MTDTIDGLKQRLVGAFVILSLAIIFLPMIFDKPHDATRASIVAVPPKPDHSPVEVKEPKKPQFERIDIDPADKRVKPLSQIAASPDKSSGANAPDKNTSNAPASSAKNKESESSRVNSVKKSEDKPAVAHLPAFNNVWMVQLGTFSDSKNAYRLRDRLREDGFDGHTKAVQIDGKSAVRVFTGPFVNKRDAERVKKKVDDKYRVNSLLIFFDP